MKRLTLSVLALPRLTWPILALLLAASMADAGGAGGPVPVVWPVFAQGTGCTPVIPNGTLRLASWPTPATTARMRAIFAADQADRVGDIDWARVGPRDLARQREVLRLLQAGKLATAEELVDAAFVFQHGNCANHYLLANTLADQAIRRGSADALAGWIYAATYDRWLTSQNRPQKFGTQYRGDASGCHYSLMPYDPRTTDAERAEYGVPPIETALANADQLNAPNCKQ